MSLSPPKSISPSKRKNAVQTGVTEGEDLGDSDPSGSYSTDRFKHILHSADPSSQPPTELTLIAALFEVFNQTSSSDAPVDYSDDCALFSPPVGRPLLITTDALCEGVHFDLQWDRFFEVGAQAAVVNLSDLAASGAEPKSLLWSLSIPPSLESSAIVELANGFWEVAHAANTPVIGGNILTREGGLEIHVTAIGSAYNQPLTRRGALPGDIIYVTGALGERALGYLDPSPETRRLRHEWRPHLKESHLLSEWGAVTAMLDISDGLLLDAYRLGQESGVTIHIDLSAIPLSDGSPHSPLLIDAALSGGEDYVLLFTAPPSVQPPLAVGAIKIGECQQPSTQDGVESVVFLDGVPQDPRGYVHMMSESDS